MNYFAPVLLLALWSCGDSPPPTDSPARPPVTPAASATEAPRPASSAALVDSVPAGTTGAITYTSITCPVFRFRDARQQADTLVKYFNRKPAADDRFFCAFPNSFAEMQRLFGYDEERGAAPLYGYAADHGLIRHFARLNGIPKDQYYRKFINICVDGRWEADNISDAFGFAERLGTDTGPACQALSQRTDREMSSVFYFIFDGPHPKNDHNERLYRQLLPVVTQHSKRLGQLLTAAYRRALAADDGHGH